MLRHLSEHIVSADGIRGAYVEPFVGGGSVFLNVQPHIALLADINTELIDLYKAIRWNPQGVWKNFAAMPADKVGYNYIRGLKPVDLDEETKAARLLYLNRTCFKGMWRHNRKGEFNIGYGGQGRRWVITENDLVTISALLGRTALMCSDFERVVDECGRGDFVFADPPYRPGHRELENQHYVGQAFTFEDQGRLANALSRASERGVQWTMTNSAHPDILSLYQGRHIVPLRRGTGTSPGILTSNSGEVIISDRGN